MIPRITGAILLSCCFLPGAGFSEDTQPTEPSLNFPERPIRIVVYTGPGGLIDFTARKFADVARNYAPQQPIVVINRPGAGGVVAFEEVLQQPADGYNILAVTRSNISKIVSVGRDDLIDRVEWFAYVMDNPHVVITNVKSGLDSWKAVEEDAHAQRGNQIWLGVDIGGVKHVSGLRVWEKTGITAKWIPYGSGGQAAAALLGEIGQVYFGNPSDTSGNPDLRLIAVGSPERMPAYPETPTFAELGVPGLESELIWRGFALRKGTPEPILRWFDDLVRKVHADPDWREQWEGEGIKVDYKPASEFHAIVKADQALFRETLQPLGLLKSSDESKWLGLVSPTTAVNVGNLLLVGLFAVGSAVLARSRKRHIFGEVTVAAAAVLAGASLLLMSNLLPKPNAVDQVGAAGVPRLWALALFLLAGMQVLISLRRRILTPDDPELGSVPKTPDLRFPSFLLALLLYLVFMSIAGYYLATLVFLLAAFLILGFRNWIPITAVTVCWLAFAHFVFQRILHVDLPLGAVFQLAQQ